MPTYTQFGDSTPEAFRLSFNIRPPFDVDDDQTAEEATREWVESMSDAELGEYIRERSTVEPW